MPFTCLFQLNNSAIDSNDEVIFDKYIEESFGAFQPDIVEIAKVMVNGKEAFIVTNCTCFPSSKGDLVFGDRVVPASIVGYFHADGEDIPYGKPYARIRFA
jgi:hypothetical protein